MLRFRLIDGADVLHVVAPSAVSAVKSRACMAARVGAVLVARAVGVVLARKERVQFDDGFVIGWVATHAWPDPTPPMTIEGA